MMGTRKQGDANGCRRKDCHEGRRDRRRGQPHGEDRRRRTGQDRAARFGRRRRLLRLLLQVRPRRFQERRRRRHREERRDRADRRSVAGLYGWLGDRLRRRSDGPVVPDQEPERGRLLRLRDQLLDLHHADSRRGQAGGSVRRPRPRRDARLLARRARHSLHARFDPPGIAFLLAGDVRLFFTDGVPPGTVYLDMAGLDEFCATAMRPVCRSPRSRRWSISTGTASSARPARRNGWPS